MVKWLVEDLNADPRLEVKGRSPEQVTKDFNGEIARYLRGAVDNLPTKVRRNGIVVASDFNTYNTYCG